MSVAYFTEYMGSWSTSLPP